MDKTDIEKISFSLSLATEVIQTAKQLLNKPSEVVTSEHSNIIIDRQRLELNEAHERNQTLIRELNAMEEQKNKEIEYKKHLLAEANEQAKENKQLKAIIDEHIKLDKTLNAQFNEACEQRDNALNKIIELKETLNAAYGRVHREENCRASYYRELEACRAELAKVRSENERLQKDADYYDNLSAGRLREIMRIRTHVDNARNQLDLEVQLGESPKSVEKPFYEGLR